MELIKTMGWFKVTLESQKKILSNHNISRSHQRFQHFFFFCLFRGHLWHMEVPRLGVESELQLPAYATATATQDPSHICNLYHSSQQHQILNPLSEARYRTHILVDNRVYNPLSQNRNSRFQYHLSQR